MAAVLQQLPHLSAGDTWKPEPTNNTLPENESICAKCLRSHYHRRLVKMVVLGA